MVLVDGFHFLEKIFFFKKQIIWKGTLLKIYKEKCHIGQVYLIPISFIDGQVIDQHS